MAPANPKPVVINGVRVRTLTTADYKPAALALAEAFEHDEVARYFVDVPDRIHWTEKQRWDLHLSLMEYVTYAHCMAGLVTSAGDDHGAIALWMPPKSHMDSLWILIRSGLWRAQYKLSPEGRRRMFKEFFPMLHHTKVAALGDRDTNSWYLVYLGTRPSARGKGYAKALIQHAVAMADKAGVPMYLESSNTVNVPYYQKFGFEVFNRVALLGNDKAVELDIMIREPGSACQQKKANEERTLPMAVAKVDTATQVSTANSSGVNTLVGSDMAVKPDKSVELIKTDSVLGGCTEIVATDIPFPKRDSGIGA